MFHEILSLFVGWNEWENWRHRVEVGVLFVALFAALSSLRGTRGERIVRALGLIAVLGGVGLLQLVRFLDLHNLEALLDALLGTFLVALIVLFQPELRRALARLGTRNSLLRAELASGGTIATLVATAQRCSRTNTGALIVITRQTGLRATIETGTSLDAELSLALLMTIFYSGTELHDGAVIVQGGRIAAAGCLLPLSENQEISKSLGTRHRAAVGLSEESDALVLIVSEETGQIALAMNGRLLRPLTGDELEKALRENLYEAPPPTEPLDSSTSGRGS